MIATPHILAGAAIAQKFSNPILGLFFAFVSHYLLDFLPHFQYDLKFIRQKNWKKSYFDFLKAVLDIFIGFFLVFIFSKKFLLASAGGFAAIMPDIFSFLFLIFPKNSFLEKHFYLHINKVNLPFNKKNPFLIGTIIQLLTILAAVLFLRWG